MKSFYSLMLLLHLSVPSQVFCTDEMKPKDYIDPSHKSIKRVRRAMSEMSLKEYMATCGSVYDIEEGDALVTTPLTKNGKYATGVECSWTIVGNHYCRPLLECEDFDIREYHSNARYSAERCREEALEVTDGLGGQNYGCARNAFDLPHLPSRPAYDLYIELIISNKTEFSRPYKGINCTVSCRRKHPLVVPVRLAQRGFRRRTQPKCVCGTRRPKKSKTIDEYPWHVAVVRKNTTKIRCSGTLINNFYVLTAASCLMNSHGAIVSRKKIDILASINTIVTNGSEDSSSVPYRIAVSKVIPHEGFNQETLDFDICLLRLWQPLDFVEKQTDLGPVCLPVHLDTEFKLMEKYVTSVGWSLADDSTPPNTRVLQKVFIPNQSNRRCERTLKRELTDRMICAGFARDGVDVCAGEPGSPLIDDDRGKESDVTQIGLASYTDGCGGASGQLSIYTRLSVYMQWIYHHTYDATWCKAKRAQT